MLHRMADVLKDALCLIVYDFCQAILPTYISYNVLRENAL